MLRPQGGWLHQLDPAGSSGTLLPRMQGMLEALRADWSKHQHQQQEAALHEAHSRGSVSVATSPGQPGEVHRLQAQVASLQEQLQEAGAQLVSAPATTQLRQGEKKSKVF